MKFTRLLFLLFLLPTSCVHAQETTDWQQLLSTILTIDDAEAEDWQENFELWEDLSQHPIDLNSATREDLERISFLTDKQIEDILSYVYQYGPMRSLGELAMIESIDMNMRRLLQCFVCIDEQAKSQRLRLSDIAKYGKHDLTLSAQIPFYERQGDKKGYLGYPYRHSFRYKFNYGNKLKIGLTGSQDAGEPFFAGRNSKGYDFYSFYASLADMGRLKKIIVGRYRATFGMGLVMNSDLAFGKLMTLTSLGRRRNAIHEHSSRSEANYMQGIAATVEAIRNTTISAFASYRYIDATLTPDDNNSIRTILTSGYHRTESEMRRHNNAKESIAGMNITYMNNGWQLGATAIYNSFSMPLKPDTRQRYRQWNAAGKDFWNIGVDYGYRNYMFSFQGETATGSEGAIATVNRLTVEPTSHISLVALQRFYSYKYVALHARSFSENGKVQNESGLYAGAEWRPLKGLNISGYADFAYFAWPRFQADRESNAYDAILQTTYQHKHWTLFARYSIKNREKNNEQKTGLTNDLTQRIRFSATFRNNIFSIRSQFDGAANKYKESGKGWMWSEHFAWQALRKIRLSVSAAYFKTDNFASRLYCYEPGLLYQMSFPAFYGKGFHLSTHIKAEISRNLMIIGKLTVTDYLDRDHISSGLERIDKSSKTDLYLQLNWRF